MVDRSHISDAGPCKGVDMDQNVGGGGGGGGGGGFSPSSSHRAYALVLGWVADWGTHNSWCLIKSDLIRLE